MSTDIRIKKGLNINLVGAAEPTTSKAVSSNVHSIILDDFHGMTPKMLVKEGAEVKAGEPIFYNKNYEAMKFVAPVSGELVEIERGARRRILNIKILADKEQKTLEHPPLDPGKATAEDIRAFLLESGCWPFIKQRPYDLIAHPEDVPKAIFISAYVTAPLAADINYTLKGKEAELQAALDALSKLTPGKVHVGIGNGEASPFAGLKGIDLHRVIKAAALAEQDYADDLTRVPHSLLVRIQYGGLLGLQRLIDNSGTSATRIADIDSLVETALARFHEAWRHETLVINQWLQVQACDPRPGTLRRVKALLTKQAWIGDAPALAVFLANNRRQRQLLEWRDQPFDSDNRQSHGLIIDLHVEKTAYVRLLSEFSDIESLQVDPNAPAFRISRR